MISARKSPRGPRTRHTLITRKRAEAPHGAPGSWLNRLTLDLVYFCERVSVKNVCAKAERETLDGLACIDAGRERTPRCSYAPIDATPLTSGPSEIPENCPGL